MSSSVVCGVDWSEDSSAALNVAVELSRRLRAQLVLAHVVEERPTFPYGSETALNRSRHHAHNEAMLMFERVERRLGAVALQPRVLFGAPADELADLAEEEDAALLVVGSRGRRALQAEQLQRGEALLQGVAAEVAAGRAPVRTRLEAGAPGAVLERCARTAGAALIVVGTHGRGPIASALLGSTSLALAAGGPVPVVMVSERAALRATQAPPGARASGAPPPAIPGQLSAPEPPRSRRARRTCHRRPGRTRCSPRSPRGSPHARHWGGPRSPARVVRRGEPGCPRGRRSRASGTSSGAPRCGARRSRPRSRARGCARGRPSRTAPAPRARAEACGRAGPGSSRARLPRGCDRA